MQGKLTITLRSIAPILGRSFWALMALTHASALGSAWKSCFDSGVALEGLGGCIALTVSMFFFALKLSGVSFLRFRPGKRAWAALFLVVALIHVNCFQPAQKGALASDCTAILATTTLVCGLTQLPRAMRVATAGPERSFTPPASAGRSNEVVWLDEFRPRCWVMASHLFNLRAPPARA